MTQVTIVLPAHSEFQTNRIRWQDTTTGLADISVLSAVGTEDRYLQRFQLDGNGADTNNQAQVRAGDDPTDSISATGHELSDAWEQSTTGITVQVPGMVDLLIQGPNGPNILTPDTTEHYLWVPGGSYTTGAITYTYSGNNGPAGLAAWVEDYKAVYAADNTIRATLILDDGQTDGIAIAFDATSGAPEATFDLAVTQPPTTNIAIEGAVSTGVPEVDGSLSVSPPPLPPSPLPPPAAPRRFRTTTRGNSVTLVWDTIEGVTAWEVCVDGVWENTGSLQPTYTVFGLAPNHRYAFRVRGLRGTDIGEPSAILTVTTRRIPEADSSPIRGWIIPLLNQPAQTLVVRLGGLDCLLRIKEADGAWFADVEIPQGAPYVAGRRMVTDSPLVDRNAEIVLGGSLTVRRVDAQETADPAGDGPWNVTHLLVFQP